MEQGGPKAAAIRRRAARGGKGDAEEWAAKMAPRPCKLPSCQKVFVPKRKQDWNSGFCCKEHQKEFWVEANRASAAAISQGIMPTVQKSEFRPGISHKDQVLRILQREENQWVSHLSQLLPGVNLNVISRLRRAGHQIEMRETGSRPFEIVPGPGGRANWRKFLPGGNVEYQYRLVVPEGK